MQNSIFPGKHLKLVVVVSLSAMGSAATAQSVGRGAPLAVDPRVTVPAMPAQPTPEQLADFTRQTQSNTVGPQRIRLRPFGTPLAPGTTDPTIEIGSAWNGEVPKGIRALPVDLFTSKDFYQDQALWKDPRYFRCNSPVALESQRGANGPKLVVNNDPKTAAWG